MEDPKGKGKGKKGKGKAKDKGKEKDSGADHRKKAKLSPTDLVEIPFDPKGFGEQLQSGMKLLHESKLLSDIELVVAGERLTAHKFVLYAWSRKFQELLKDIGSAETLEVKIDPKNLDNFKLMLEYMYTGTSSQRITSSNVMDLLDLCHEFGIAPLKEECGDFLFDSSEDINAVYLLELAEKYEAKRLEKKCAEYLAENFEDLMEQEDNLLMKLRVSTWVELIKSDEVKVTREEDLFNTVLKYADMRGATNEESRAILTQLLPHIRFSLCSPKFLVEEVERNKALMDIPILKQLLFETFRYRVNPKCTPLFTQINTKRRKANLNVLLQWDKDQPFTHGVYTLENDGFTAHKSSQPGTIYVLRTKGRLEPPGRYYWEVSIEQMAGSQELHIGIAEDNFNFHTAYLRAPGSYYIERHGGLMTGHNQVASGPRLSVNDNIGFSLDFEEETLTVFHNGTPCHTFSGVRGNMWPCVAARDVGTKLTLVGKSPKLYKFGESKQKGKGSTSSGGEKGSSSTSN